MIEKHFWIASGDILNCFPFYFKDKTQFEESMSNIRRGLEPDAYTMVPIDTATGIQHVSVTSLVAITDPR